MSRVQVSIFMSFQSPRAVVAICAALALPGLSQAALPNSEKKRIQDYESAAPRENLPAPSLIALARAYRDATQWDKALVLFRQGERRFPSQVEFTLGRIMTLADARRIPEAVSLGRKLVRRQPRNPDSHLALGYAYQIGGQPYAELDQATEAYGLAPGRAYVVRSYIQALQNAGLAQNALREAQAHPGAMDAGQIRSLQADAAARLTRVAATSARGEAERYAVADRAIAMYDALIAQWQALGAAARSDVRRLQADRLLALHARARMKDVVAGYQALLAQGVAVPAYVLGDVADAYLYLRQPETAAHLYRRSLASAADKDDPKARVNDQAGLFYALTESGHADQANAELKAADAEQPVWLYIPGDPSRQPNDLKLDLALTQGQGDLYEGDTPQAQARLDAMVDAAPGNTRFYTARSQIYRSRGLPRRAERDLALAQAQSPRSIDVETNQGETALDLQEWRQARLLRDDVVSRSPQSLSVQDLARDWDIHNMSELRVTAGRDVSTNSPVVGSHETDLSSTLYSPPIDENWRAFAGTGYSYSDFPEGVGTYRWARAGAQWRSRGITLQGEVSGNDFGYGLRAGAALSGSVDLDDHWQVGGGAALLSRDATPLRALRHDITANSLNANVRWRGDNRTQWTFSFTPSRFTDGNTRMEIDAAGLQRVYTSHRFRLDAMIDLSASHNTLANAPYYNPRSDLAAVPELRLTHVLYQRYDTAWEQQLTAGAGTYTEQGYGTSGLYTVSYGQRFRYNKVLDTGFTLSATSRTYDGQRERDYAVLVDLTYRF